MNTIYETIKEQATAMRDQLRAVRRDLHTYAEAGWCEIRTSSLIAKRLTELGYQVLTGPDVCLAEARMGLPPEEQLEAEYQRALQQGAVQPYAERARGGFTGVIGILDCGEGPTIAMRFDIDALGVFEDKGMEHLPAYEGFCSVNDGVMHACGHDGHVSIGLGVAEILMNCREQLRGKVKLIFQPAEEGVRGAKSIVEHGHLDDVDYVIGNHMGDSAGGDYQIGQHQNGHLFYRAGGPRRRHSGEGQQRHALGGHGGAEPPGHPPQQRGRYPYQRGDPPRRLRAQRDL